MTKSVDVYGYDSEDVDSVAGPSAAEQDYHFVNQKIIDRSNRRVENQVWHHGKIKRIAAINLLKKDGDFLVRDSISNPGDYVLTGRCNGEVMHFEINRAPTSDPNSDLYYFEDEQFRSVIDLIEFYYGHRRQVTAKSQFVLLNPIAAPDKSDSQIFNRFQYEIEAAYAPFISRQLQFPSSRYDRSLSHTAILNQAKKRINGSEHNLLHAVSNMSNSASLSSSFSCLKQSSNSGLKVTTFGVNEAQDLQPAVSHYVPPIELRPVPSFAPPQPHPVAQIEDTDDYDQLDYSTMESVMPTTPMKAQAPPVLRQSPPSLPPKPANLKAKRLSDYMETIKALDDIIPEPKPVTKRPSVHSLFNSAENDEAVDEENNLLPVYLDRTQSCSNLVLRQRSRSSKCQDDDPNVKKYPSVRVDPQPMLPARSNTSLNSLSALTQMLNEKRSDAINVDYDDVRRKGVQQTERDYDYLKENERPPAVCRDTPKTRLFTQMKTSSTTSKPMRNLLNFLMSLSSTKLSLMITSEDCSVFKLNSDSTPNISESLRTLFMADSKVLREEILDRNACLQLTVLASLQKSTAPGAFAKTWIMTCAHLLHKIGNGFAFGAVMAALKSEFGRKPRLLADLDQPVVSLYKGLSPVYDDFVGGKMPPAVAGCFLPFIQPLLQMFSNSDYMQTSRTKSVSSDGLVNLDVLSNLVLLARHVLFENASRTSTAVQTFSAFDGLNPLSSESLVHCILNTAAVSETKESEKRKIRQLLDVSL